MRTHKSTTLQQLCPSQQVGLCEATTDKAMVQLC